MSRDTAVVLFARLPVPGKAKTRLAKDVGPDAAADLYRRMAERAFAATASSSRAASRTLCFSEASEAEGIQLWVEAMGDTSLRLAPQCASPDLGERMRYALNRALERGGEGGGRCAKAIVVGTDVPDLSAAHVDAAAAALDDHDVVFGPAVDGGYYLLGVRRPVGVAQGGGDAMRGEAGRDAEAAKAATATAGGEKTEKEKALVPPSLFRGVPWSTETVLRDSLVAARGAGLKAAKESTLPCLRDVDVLGDVAALVAKADEASNAADDDDAFLAAARALL
jgi:rSAM/selenodomain-associated transferase 1